MTKTSTMDQTVRVELTDERLMEHAHRIATLNASIHAMEAKRSEASAAAKKEIDYVQAEIDKLCQEIREGEEEKAQRDLRFGEVPSTPEAQAALARVAAATGDACTAVDALACPEHGSCSCEPGPAVPLACAKCQGEAAACIGTEESAVPGCNLCCDHEGDLCRPIAPEDQPKPTTAPEVKAIDCKLHGVDAEHSKARAAEVPVAAQGAEEAADGVELGLHDFKGRAEDEDPEECEVCGYEEAAALHRVHAYEPDGTECGLCGLAKEDPIHAVPDVAEAASA